jgi:TolB-like protein/Tfp pilus assembly protein PilF/predicted Ser/Thr protein kinase
MKCPNCLSDNPDDTYYCGKCGTKFDGLGSFSVTKTVGPDVLGPHPGVLFAGRYEIVRELGRGGMGVVFKAIDTKLKRTVALKFLPPEWTYDVRAKERFAREAQAAAALDHPHICTVHEIDEAEGRMFISMAFVEGESLKDRVGRGPLKLDEVLDLGRQVAEGLKEAHAKGIIHRDIKSANIMVAANGQARIMDFGLARVQGGPQLTREGKMMGTVAYMSPEQAQGEGVDHRSDLWSLGVVLYEALSGRLPFRGEHEQSVIYSILKENPKPVSAERPEIPASLAQVVQKALEKNRDKRYQSAEDLMDDLSSIAEGIVPERIKVRQKQARRRGRKRTFLFAGLAGLLPALFIAGWMILSGRAQAMDSLAVLPLENLTGDSQQDYFSEGMHEALITALARVGGLKRVIARSSVLRFKGSEIPLSKVAQELRVEGLVTGAVLRSGNRVRVTAQLVDPETEAQVWARSFEGELSDVLALQNEIVSAIVREIRVQLTPQEKTRLADARQVNPEAYDACLRGRFNWYKLTRPGLEAALKDFEVALQKDPEYAPAYAGIATVWQGYMQQGFVPATEATSKLKAAALKALELDSTLAEIHFTLATISTWTDWDWLGAERAFRRAIELNPKYPDPRIYYSHFLQIMKRPQEAMVQADRAVELDPLNPLFQGLYAMDLLYARRYDDAVALLLRTLKASPNDAIALSTLRSVYHMKKTYPEAIDIWRASYAAKGDREAGDALDLGFKGGGYQGALRSVAETFVARLKTAYVTPWQIATLYTRAGDRDEALAWLEKAYETRDANMPYLNVDPIFDDLRSDPRFQDLLRRMKLL